MTDNEITNNTNTSHGEPAVETDIKTDNTPDQTRTADIGESGQHAPGGYYNQQEATQTERINLDEQVSDALDDKS